MQKLNIANYISCTEVEGPGKRFAIWVQGCAKKCKGCCNPEMQPLVANKVIDANYIIQEIIKTKKKENIEGVTFLGGEPFLQAKGLSKIAIFCQKIGLSVIVFSGYTLSEIKENNYTSSKLLLDNCDVLIDGEFDEKLLDNKRNWIGSSNQKIHYYSDFYQKNIEYDKQYIDGIEFRIETGKITLNGDPIDII